MYGQEGPSRSHVSERNTGQASGVGPLDGGKGFFQSLFDFSFSHFVTPKLVRLAYVFAVLGFGLLAVGGLLMGLARGGGTALAAVVFIPLIFLAWTAFVRIILEIFIVVFRIAEPVREAASSLEELRRLTVQGATTLAPTSAAGETSAVSVQGRSGLESMVEEGSTLEEGEHSDDEEANEGPGATVGQHVAPAGHRFCVECGTENKEENRFCFSCGAGLE